MTSFNTVKAVERQLQQAKEHVEFGNALQRLRSNREFVKVVSEGYFEKEAVRLVHLKADVSMQNEASQLAIVKQIDAIGAFSSYLQLVVQQAMMAEKSVASLEEDRNELLEGGLL